MKSLSRVQLFATTWTVAYQAPSSTGFSRQGSWSGLPFPSPEDLHDPGIEPGSLTLPTGKPCSRRRLNDDLIQLRESKTNCHHYRNSFNSLWSLILY